MKFANIEFTYFKLDKQDHVVKRVFVRGSLANKIISTATDRGAGVESVTRIRFPAENINIIPLVGDMVVKGRITDENISASYIKYEYGGITVKAVADNTQERRNPHWLIEGV